MAYKDLLVHVDDTRACAARVQAAIDLAIAHEAHLTAVYVITDPSPAAFVQNYLPPTTLDALRAEADKRTDAVLARFAEVAKRNRISFESRTDRVLYTAMAEALATHARYADVVILGQADPDDGDAPGYLPEEVTLASGRPSLVIPYIGPAATLGRRVTVAWDASREAARAVNDALPILKRAEAVGVVSVNPATGPSATASSRARTSRSISPATASRSRSSASSRATSTFPTRSSRTSPTRAATCWSWAHTATRACASSCSAGSPARS